MNDSTKRQIRLLRLAGYTVYQIAAQLRVGVADVLRVLDSSRGTAK